MQIYQTVWIHIICKYSFKEVFFFYFLILILTLNVFLVFFRTNARLYFNVTVSNYKCHLFAAFNFTYVENWPLYFNECAHDNNNKFFFHNLVKKGGGTGATIDLVSTQCLKYDLLSGVNSCDCHMDCLLQFKLGRYSYIYLEGINCNETTFNNSLIIFERSENLRSNFTLKKNYPNCSNTPGIISNHLQQGSHYNYFLLQLPVAPQLSLLKWRQQLSC